MLTTENYGYLYPYRYTVYQNSHVRFLHKNQGNIDDHDRLIA